MCDILDAAKPGHWHHKMLEQDMEYGAHMENIDSYVEFLHRFYRSDAYEEKFNQLKRNENKRKNNDEEGTTTNKKKKRRSAPKEGKGKGSKPLCNICKRHHDGTCWFKEGGQGPPKNNNGKRVQWKKNTKGPNNGNDNKRESQNMVTLNKEDLFKLVAEAAAGRKGNGKRKREEDSDEGSCDLLDQFHLHEKMDQVDLRDDTSVSTLGSSSKTNKKVEKPFKGYSKSSHTSKIEQEHLFPLSRETKGRKEPKDKKVRVSNRLTAELIVEIANRKGKIVPN